MFTACIGVNVDYLATFNVRGTIVRDDDSTALSGVKIVFVDTGFDSIRSHKGNQIQLCLSDDHGRVDHDFEYFWGYNKGLMIEKPSQSFDIFIQCDGFEDEKICYNAVDLQRINGKIIVSLGEVRMKRK